MKEKTFWALAVVVVVVGAFVWYSKHKPAAGTESAMSPTPSQNAAQSTGGTAPSSGGEQQNAPQGPRTYANAAYGFSFEYPSSASLETSGFPAGGFMALGAQGVIAVYTRIDTVVDRLVVSVSAEPSDVGDCDNVTRDSSTATIGGVPFVKTQSIETLQGVEVTTTVYRVHRKNFCYELREIVTASDLAKLTAPQVAAQNANKAATSAYIGSVLQSFRFTQ